MIIENLDALKFWLSKTLEPICDADPSALAKYVVALVKKEKSEKELKALCIDQLDVFLQKETQTFVDKLFEAVNTKSYLPQLEQPLLAVRTEAPQRPEKEDQKKEEINKEDDRDKKFSRRVTYSPQQSSSRYRDNRRGDDRKKEDRSRRRDHDRNPPRRDSYRDRYNRRRGHSRSRSRSKDRPRDRDRERDRDRDRSRSRTRSPSRSRGRCPEVTERDCGKLRLDPPENYSPAAAVTGTTSAHFPVPVLSSTITVIAPTHHGNSTTESWSQFHRDRLLEQSGGSFVPGPPPRKRCRDYDEKGFCMRGDMCPFDHGTDPVVVEDVNLPSILPFQAQPHPVLEAPPPPPPPGLPAPPPLMTPPPVNLLPPVPPVPGTLPPSLPPVTGPPPPLPPLRSSGMAAPPSSMAASVPTMVSSVIRPPPPQPPPALFNSDAYEVIDVYNPEAPSITSSSRPMYRHPVNAQRPNLIGLTMSETDLPPREKMSNSNSVRIVVESNNRKRPAGPNDGGVHAKKPWYTFSKPNRQGFQKVTYGPASTQLSIRQIPAELNNITKLNEHFSKFGTIVNLQVAYRNDPESALIRFSTHEEAKRAILSTEAVLNNRFIKVHWHREDCPALSRSRTGLPPARQPPVMTLKQSVKDRLGPLPISNLLEPPQDSNAATQNTPKMSVKDRLGFSSHPVVAGGKVLSTSTGLTKTVYNPAALKVSQNSSAEALKKKQEALRLQQDVRKKKHEILEKQIETQKLLISKLENNKSIKPEDKARIMETLTTLTENISKLQEEMKAISRGNPVKTQKSKAQAQKELLDTELDLYKKMQAGEDIVHLRKKYTQLQLEAAKRGILGSGRGRGGHARGRGDHRCRGRGIRGRGRGAPVLSVVDHRPRALEIAGFAEPDRVDLLPHFAQFGEIEDYQIDDSANSAVITYRSRGEAELAAVHGVKFNNQALKLAWHKPAVPLSSADPDEVDPEDEEFQEAPLVDNAMQQDEDEEDDEDNEPRSWRR